MSLAQSLEKAASELAGDADAIRPANGDPIQLLDSLDGEAAARVLSWLLAHEAAAGGELASAWLDQLKGIEAIGQISEAELPKAGRKALRRVAHRARSRGIALAGEETASAPRVARLPSVEKDVTAGFLCPYDPSGARLVYLVEAHPAGGARLYEAVLNEDRGILDFQAYRVGRSQLRDFERSITRRDRFAALETTAGAVKTLIAERLERHPADRLLPKAFDEWRGRVIDGAGEQSTPARMVEEALGTNTDTGGLGDALDALARQVRASDLGPWPPPPDALEQATVELRDRVQVQQASEQDVDREWLADALREAVGELYRGESSGSLADRLSETAYLFWKQEEEALARACLATAAQLRGGESEDNPVVEAFIDGLATQLRAQLVGLAPPAADEADDSEEEMHEAKQE
jgi:hypothetical protein